MGPRIKSEGDEVGENRATKHTKTAKDTKGSAAAFVSFVSPSCPSCRPLKPPAARELERAFACPRPQPPVISSQKRLALPTKDDDLGWVCSPLSSANSAISSF